jgi:DMSO/TMAO reductase YedYZ molybdopterin-dependent catalytic subunit
VRYKDVLAAEPKASAVYTGHYGTDVHFSGDPDKVVISRGMPMRKAMMDNTLIAFAMNGAPIPSWNGFPVRVVASGWPGSVSRKRPKRIRVRNVEHDGEKMTGYSHRVPAHPAEPGEKVAEKDMRIIEETPVKSIIIHPVSGIDHAAGKPLEVRGHAWSGDRKVTAVDVSVDYGASWTKAGLAAPRNAGTWQRWRSSVKFPGRGYRRRRRRRPR